MKNKKFNLNFFLSFKKNNIFCILRKSHIEQNKEFLSINFKLDQIFKQSFLNVFHQKTIIF